MDKLVVLLYDLAAVLIILMTVAYNSERGFATGLVRIIGRLAAFFGAAFLAKYGAEFLYSGFIRSEVLSFLNRNLTGGQAGEIVEQLQAAAAALPHISGNILGTSIDLDAISAALANSTEQAVSVLEQNVIGPAIQGFVTAALFVLIFGVLGLLVRVLTSAVHFVFRSPILAPIDRFLGGAVGLVQASINLYLICMIFKLVFYLVGGMKYFNQSIITDTLILSKFYNFDPLSLFV